MGNKIAALLRAPEQERHASLPEAIVSVLKSQGPCTRLTIALTLGRQVNACTTTIRRLIARGVLEEGPEITQVETGAKSRVIRLKGAV